MEKEPHHALHERADDVPMRLRRLTMMLGLGRLNVDEHAPAQFDLAWLLAGTLPCERRSIKTFDLQCRGVRGVFPCISRIRRRVVADIVPFHLAGPRPCRLAGECRVLVDRPDP